MMQATSFEKSTTWAFFSVEDKREFWATLALRHCRGIGLRTRAQLLRAFGSALKAIERPQDWARVGVGADKIAEFCTGSWRVTAEKEWQAAQCVDCEIILWTDPRYPQILRDVYAPPALLYCQGDMTLLNAPGLAIVGSRYCSALGRKQTAAVAHYLAENGITVVSGMAFGIDAAAHEAALPCLGRSIGVLGTGIDIAYPERNAKLFSQMRQYGLLVSEFAPGSTARPESFPIRNRIISGLALAVLVIEAAARSGSLLTARNALEHKRAVYVWGDTQQNISEGCRQLTQVGAGVVSSASQVLQALAPQLRLAAMQACLNRPQQSLQHIHNIAPQVRDDAVQQKQCCTQKTDCPPPTPAGAPDNAEVVLHYIWQHPSCYADNICEDVGISAMQLNVVIIFLEMKACVRRLPGGRFCCVGGAYA